MTTDTGQLDRQARLRNLGGEAGGFVKARLWAHRIIGLSRGAEDTQGTLYIGERWRPGQFAGSE